MRAQNKCYFMLSDNVYHIDGIKLTFGLPFYLVQSYSIAYSKRFKPIAAVAKNWWSVVLVHLGISKSATIRLRGGKEYHLTKGNISDFMIYAERQTLPEAVKRNLKFNGGMAVFSLNGRKLKLRAGAAAQIASEFYYGKHAFIGVKGKDVVDVGAYVGDSPLYYIFAGRARHVYAFEPYRRYFDLADKVVKDNGLSSRITMFKYAVAGTDSIGFINEESDDFVVSNKGGSGSKKVSSISLDTIVKKLKLRNAALKVDCEGCERGIFASVSSNALKSFDVIHVEYHYGYRDVVERLRAEGYRVKYTNPRYNFKGFGVPGMVFGDIIAIRTGSV